MMMNFLLSVTFGLFALQRASAGVACFAGCATACTAVGPAAFAGPLGIAVGYTGCTGVCMVACAVGSFVPPACYHGNTTVQLQSGAVVTIDAIKAGDSIFDGAGNWTTVIRNDLIREEDIEFREFIFDTNFKLTVTKEHGVIVMKESPVVMAAENINIGDKMIPSGTVVQINTVHSNEKYNLETTTGTVWSSDVITSTMCANEFHANGSPLDPTVNQWKIKHGRNGI